MRQKMDAMNGNNSGNYNFDLVSTIFGYGDISIILGVDRAQIEYLASIGAFKAGGVCENLVGGGIRVPNAFDVLSAHMYIVILDSGISSDFSVVLADTFSSVLAEVIDFFSYFEGNIVDFIANGVGEDLYCFHWHNMEARSLEFDKIKDLSNEILNFLYVMDNHLHRS